MSTQTSDRERLKCAFDLLHEALPLALERLKAGGVELRTQESFWSRFTALDDELGDDTMAGYVSEPGEVVESTLCDLAADMRRAEFDASDAP